MIDIDDVEEDELDTYIYIDGTAEGASKPYYYHYETRVEPINESALSDEDKVKNYFGTVRSSVPYEVYKINDKFYDGNGLEISKEEVDKLDFFNVNKSALKEDNYYEWVIGSK